MLHKLISFKYMIISFAIGLFFVYVFGPDNKIIYINPSQDTQTKKPVPWHKHAYRTYRRLLGDPRYTKR